jgi:hypothetical protein
MASLLHGDPMPRPYGRDQEDLSGSMFLNAAMSSKQFRPAQWMI